MLFMVCSVYRSAKLLLKKPVNIDPAETLGALFDRLPLEGQSAHQYYLLPEDYARVERSGVAISVNGTSEWISASADDTLDMCRSMEMKYIRFRCELMTVETVNPNKNHPSLAGS